MKKAQRHVQDEKNACELRNAAQQTGKCRGYILAESSNLQKRGEVQGNKRKGPWPEMKARPRLASALIAVPMPAVYGCPAGNHMQWCSREGLPWGGPSSVFPGCLSLLAARCPV